MPAKRVHSSDHAAKHLWTSSCQIVAALSAARRYAVLIGVSMGVLAFLVDIFLQRLNSFKYSAVKTVVANHGGFWAPYMVWLCFTMGYAALSAYLVTSFAPLGAGSGIPEIKTYLNGVHIKGLRPARCCALVCMCHCILFVLSASAQCSCVSCCAHVCLHPCIFCASPTAPAHHKQDTDSTFHASRTPICMVLQHGD